MSIPWFRSFLRTHLARHCTIGLPDPRVDDGGMFYGAWEEEFERLKITEFAADRASIRLMSKQPPLRYHFKDLCKLAQELLPKQEEAVSHHQADAHVYERPPAPRGSELVACVATARAGPFARLMRLELRRYILDGELRIESLPSDVGRLVANEPETTPESIPAPRLRRAV